MRVKSATGRALVIAWAVTAACGAREPLGGGESLGARELGARGSLGARERHLADLRLQLASDPRDPALHAALGRALLAAGQPGAALRHLEDARRRASLDAADSRRLAILYRERARARLTLGEGDAWRDVEASARLDPDAARAAPVRELLRETYFAGALAALRRADRPGRRAADRLLAAAAPLAPSDSRLAARDPSAADLADVGAAGAWLAEGGARRAALDLYAVYVARGGRAAAHLARYLALHRWWYGDRERPSAAILAAARAEGLDLCGVARSLADLGCGESLVRAAEHDPRAAEAIRRLAAVRGWRTADPRVAAAWTVVALRAWLDREVDSWDAEIAARVDLAALTATETGLAGIPPHARATLLRVAGRRAEGGEAFARAVEQAGRLAPEARALLVAEAATRRRGDGMVEALLHAGPASPTAWRAALTAARAVEPGGEGEVTLCDAAPLAIARDHLREQGELGALAARFPSPPVLHALARWRAALDGAGDPRLRRAREVLEARWRRLAAGAALSTRLPAALPLGVADPHRLAGADRITPALARKLARLARAYLHDPALADRLAMEFADGALARGQRGPLLVDLFARLGDPARAWSWAERVHASSPDHADYLLLAGLTAAAAGDSARADVFFVRGAAASGDAGAASLLAARGFLASSRALPALTAARRAFDLTAPGEPEHAAAIDLAARSLDLLGRQGEAAGLRGRLPAGALAGRPLDAAPLSELKDAPASSVGASSVGASSVGASSVGASSVGVSSAGASSAGASSAGASSVGAPIIDARSAVDASSVVAPGWAVDAASRLALGLIAPPERAAQALAEAADALERAGLRDLAGAVRRERRSLLGVTLPDGGS